MAIVGAPNAGKSSLLNTLAARDAAIVSPTPGTTRDAVEVAVELEGYKVRFGLYHDISWILLQTCAEAVFMGTRLCEHSLQKFLAFGGRLIPCDLWALYVVPAYLIKHAVLSAYLLGRGTVLIC